MKNEFQIGDVVQLNSGGPKMTVNNTEHSWVMCTYWDEKEQKFKPITLDYALLTKIEKRDQFAVTA